RWRKTAEQATDTGFDRGHWTTGDDHGRMTLADELGGPLTGATNEKPRLGKQPGFSSLHLQELILPNPTVRANAPAAMTFKAKAACDDEDDSLSHLGLCSDLYVSWRVPTILSASHHFQADVPLDN